ncbi:NAD(P)-dependent alcohol dehydrogenase [Granulicella tundricola]|uniref:alcohol dehydrogenase (NADP(+)) n=1 Tax=Granulicella tundricola (strain ATCC BAA-1859 / DSM 23138 / MP5ACTX9) TaxID=1198114 RepID=E8WWA5_GRATM|nr:NAD(P)-dependent alcohol dehydrogenase [Granulicella tundricola]ADW68488.1 Alcohol dehydrogenase zinc-binding domain protein [Granulicella tundricola MP5ACTX9]
MNAIHGLAVHAAGAHLLPYKYDAGELKEDEVEVKISHCGVCYSDVHLIDNDWSISKYPFIPGHEIVGTITQIGSAVDDRVLGERVGIGWQANSCSVCEWCRQGDEHLCAKSQPTCVGRNGGYADSIRVNWRFALRVPEVLESENVAPLLCGGITVYSPLRNLGVRPSSRVGIIGIGGLGHMGIQFAKAFGAEVTAFSTSKDKEAEALELGAHHFVNTRDTGAIKKVAGSFDLLLSTVNADQDWQGYVNALRPKGSFVFLGAPPTPVPLQVSALIFGQKCVAGSPTGSPHDIEEMLDVAARHGIKAITERFEMAKANEAVAKVKKNQVRYRAVLAN